MTPELQALFETIKAILGTSETLALWWMILHYGSHFINNLLGACVVMFLGYRITMLIAKII